MFTWHLIQTSESNVTLPWNSHYRGQHWKLKSPFSPKLSKAFSPSALLSFKACTCFYVTWFQPWMTYVFHFRPTLTFMWETDKECVMSRMQDYRSCGRDSARYLRVGRRRMETAGSLQSVWARWQWSGVCVYHCPDLCGNDYRRWQGFLWRSCLLCVWDSLTIFFFLNVLLVPVWVRWRGFGAASEHYVWPHI